MNRPLLIAAACALILVSGCANRKDSPSSDSRSTPQTGTENAKTRWYYFSASGIHEAASPSEIPATDFKPWTEATRVTDAAMVGDRPVLLINRLGLMEMGTANEPPALRTDSLFANVTAAGLCKTGETTAIRAYRNSFFATANETGANDWLVAYDDATGRFNGLLSAADIGLPSEAQCVALDRVGSMWYASFKIEKAGKVDFTYLEFESFPARSATGAAPDLAGVRKITKDAYQKSVEPFSFADLPETLAFVAKAIPETTPARLRVWSRSARQAQTWARSGEGTILDGCAWTSDERVAVLFADGLLFYKADPTSEKPAVVQLPKLSRGYVYTSFVMTGDKILAAWEEQRFFETGRSGLLETTLPDGIY